MKLTINAECTPEEARAFLGLPDMTPVHRAWVERVVLVMGDTPWSADVETVMRRWVEGWPGMADMLDQWRKGWTASGGSGATTGKP